jgi:AraC-like DNA-binding protein
MTRILDRWHHIAADGAASTVYPDGCRDVIVWRVPGRAPRLTYSPLQDRTLWPRIGAGTALTGYRLRAGTVLDLRQLERALGPRDPGDTALAALIDEVAAGLPAVDAGLAALATLPASVAQGARRLGCSQRSLERAFAAAGLPPPGFWLQLARARKAALEVVGGAPLAEAAQDAGYADQAHMTRALRRWFAAPPSALRRDPGAAALLGAPAYAGATGEQISTR